MKYINTRFSYERRVKLILTCSVFMLTAFLLFGFTSYSEPYTEPPASVNLIRTSYSEDNYSVFEAAGNRISARGKYTEDHIRKLYIDKNEDVTGSYSMKAHEDGTYEAELELALEDGEYMLTVKLNSGTFMKYRIFYKNGKGWYFPLNGLEKSNRLVFEHIFEAPSAAAALYLSPTADAEEMSAALEQIKGLAEQVTEGMEDDYEKAHAISDFIAKTIYYDLDARDTNVDGTTIALCNVLKTGKTTCAGFANLFCAMAEAVGIDAVNIKGGVTADDITYEKLTDGVQNHEFCAFYYEKESRWVWTDACWEGTGNYKDGKFIAGAPRSMYFDISDEALSMNHRADKAERRHYFEATAETVPLGVTEAAEGEPQAVITSEQTTAAVDEPDAAGSVTAAEEAEPAADAGSRSVSSADSTVYIVIIAVLSAAVVAAAVILIKTIKNGRKN